MFLPAERRQAITALYAFCREVDDVGRNAHDIQIAQTKLDWWRLADCRSLRRTQPPRRPSAQDVSTRFSLPREQPLEIIDGMAMDLRKPALPRLEGLQPSLLPSPASSACSAEIFGYTNRQTLKYAHDLGLAFQLTNIIRDVGEDARRGRRIYLPIDDAAFQRAGQTDSTANIPPLPRTDDLPDHPVPPVYAQAFAQLPAEDRKAPAPPGLIMAAIYRTLLDEIEADGFQVLDRRTCSRPCARSGRRHHLVPADERPARRSPSSVAWLRWLCGGRHAGLRRRLRPFRESRAPPRRTGLRGR